MMNASVSSVPALMITPTTIILIQTLDLVIVRMSLAPVVAAAMTMLIQLTGLPLPKYLDGELPSATSQPKYQSATEGRRIPSAGLGNTVGTELQFTP